MRKQASKTVIGSFVISALALVVIGVLVFGSGNFFKKNYKLILFFRESVKGLSVGAPVVFMGVKIGEVKDITAIEDPSKPFFVISVIIEVQSDKVKKGKIKRFRSAREAYEYIDHLIKQGLRAQLGLQSFITGQLQVELDIHPKEKAVFMGINKEYHEIPTIPSTYEKLAKKMENLPIEKIFNNLSSILARIDVLVNSPEIPESIHSLNLAIKDAKKILHKINEQVEPLTHQLDKTLEAYKTLAQNLDRQVEPVSSNVNETLKALAETTEQAEKTLKNIENTVGKDSVIAAELSTTLTELSSAARSIRNLANYLYRQPNALIRGKGGNHRGKK